MIDTEDGKNSLEQLAVICDIASSDRNLSSLKQKFQDFAISEDSQTDEVLKTSIEKEIHQILASQTLERAKHYVRMLRRSLKNNGLNSPQALDISRWKGYDHIITDSLWNLGYRARGENHKAWYWGNFVPQIPFQLISRYTAPGDWVLDPFCGSGTTLVEAKKLRRHSLGIELNNEVYRKTGESLSGIGGDSASETVLINGNSLKYDFRRFADERGIEGFKLAILHPPYWDIIRFSDSPDDLSTSVDVYDFTSRLESLVKGLLPSMSKSSHVALVIGDMYRHGEVIPLGFRSMEKFLDAGLKLRGIVVKDIQNTRAKRSSESLWRYRALKSGFYVFKHEYVFVFKVP